MFNVTKFPHGTISWADLSSTDQAASRAFYATLMGWDVQEWPMGEGQTYSMFNVDGSAVAAVGQMQPDMMAQGAPSFWITYVTVDDVDALAPQVTALGGTLVNGPFDVFDNGRMLILQDPSGAMLALWQPKNHIGAGLVNTVGAMCWNELATRDPQAAGEFLSKLLGWEIKKADDMDNYYYIYNGDRINGGIMQMTDEWGDIPPHWMVYFTVADIDAAVAQVKELGGSVNGEIIDAGEVGRMAVVSDPTGAVCSFIQTGQPDPWIE